jgi:1-deoxy-D-xylulose 5-phosphate reductoisomerase
MIAFHNDMFIPIYHYLNQKYNYKINENIYSFKKNNQLNFKDVKLSEFPVYKLFKELDKSDPSNIIKFNVANEYAVDSFKNGEILYTDIYKIIDKFTSLNLNYKLNNIKDIINYHEFLEIKVNENY